LEAKFLSLFEERKILNVYCFKYERAILTKIPYVNISFSNRSKAAPWFTQCFLKYYLFVCLISPGIMYFYPQYVKLFRAFIDFAVK